jgi:hypothetical protein
MRIFAYCDKRYEQATRKAVGGGAKVVTCPPFTADSIARHAGAFNEEIGAAELVYLNLHAMPGRAEWFTTDGLAALYAETLSGFDLHRAIVFMVNCYAGGGMLDALKATKPRAIIGGDGENLGALNALAGADVLGLWFRRGLQLGLGVRQALALGKARLGLTPKTRSVKDALQFEVLHETSQM